MVSMMASLMWTMTQARQKPMTLLVNYNPLGNLKLFVFTMAERAPSSHTEATVV